MLAKDKSGQGQPSMFSVRIPTPAFMCFEPWKRPKLRVPWDSFALSRFTSATIQCSVTKEATRRPITTQLIRKVAKTKAFVLRLILEGQLEYLDGAPGDLLLHFPGDGDLQEESTW